MDSNLITPPDILKNNLHSVTIIDPEQDELDAIVKLCQHSDRGFNIYVYTPNMSNLEWLSNAIQVSDAVIVNSRTNAFNDICLRENCYYYGPQLYLENPRKINDPLHYFAAQLKLAK